MSYTRTALAVLTVAMSLIPPTPSVQPAAIASQVHAMAVPGGPAKSPAQTTDRSGIVSIATAQTDITAVAEAERLFTANDFATPNATVTFSRSADDCGGMRGRTYLGDGTPNIVVCATNANPTVERQWRTRTLLHELAHAWIAENVPTKTQDDFIRLRRLDVWADRDHQWARRATEHAAEILIWGLTGGGYHVDFRLDNTSCVDLAAGYELLTGLHLICATENLAGIGASGDPHLPRPAPTAVIGTATIYAETDDLVEMARWALEQFDNAGIPLPAVTLHLYQNNSSCSNDPDKIVNGYYTQVDGENIIHDCGSRSVLLHELGHVWDKNYLDDATRQRFLDFEGLETWNSDVWDQAGGEHLASVISWALDGTHPSRIGYYTDDHLAGAYELVFGATPPIMEKPVFEPVALERHPDDAAVSAPPAAASQDPS